MWYLPGKLSIMCFASKMPSEWVFFIPIRMHLDVKLFNLPFARAELTFVGKIMLVTGVGAT